MQINTANIKKYFNDKTNIIIFSLLVLITIFGAIVRFKNLGVLAYWGDDGHTFLGTLGVLKYGIPKYPSGTIMYHTMLSFYFRAIPSYIFGLNEVALRFPSAFFGTLAIPLIFLFVKDMFNKYAAIIAAAILSFSIWQIAFSRETRYYSEFQFFYLLSIYLFYRGYFREEKKFKIASMICIFLTILIHQLGFTLIFLFIPLLVYKRFKGFFKKNIIISFFIVLFTIIGHMLHRELFWEAGLSFYQSNVPAEISNPILRILSKYVGSFETYYINIFKVLFPQMYYIVIYGTILIIMYLFIHWIRGKEEDFIDIYSHRQFSIKLPFNLFFLYFIFFVNAIFNGLGAMNLQPRYIYYNHVIFIAIYCYIVFDIARLVSLGIKTIYSKIKRGSSRYKNYIKTIAYFASCAIILVLTVNWVNPVSNLKIIYTENGDSVNNLFAVSSTFNFHHDPKTPGEYIYNNKQSGDIVIATDLLNPYGYTHQIDYWLWTGGGFAAWQPYIYKDDKIYDESFGVPVITDIYQFYNVLNENTDKNIWLITSNSVRVPSHISPDVAEFIGNLEEYKATVGKDGVCSAYLFPKIDEETRGFFFIPKEGNIINIDETSSRCIIDFKQPSNQPYFEYGWSKVEPHGTWAEGTYSILFLNFYQKKDYIMKLAVKPLPNNEKKQEVTIILNNQKIGDIIFEDTEFREYSFNINQDLVKIDKYSILELNYKYSISPKELGMSSDTRKLSVYFDRILFESK